MPRIAPRAYDFDDADARGGLAVSALDLLARRPLDVVAGLLAAACTLMILVNALLLQQGRAPQQAPLPQAEAARPSQSAARQAAPSSDLVVQVQTALAERELYDGVVDGAPRAGTEAAIRAFEQSQGMVPTGVASEKVLAALMTAPMRKAEAARPVQKPAAASAGGLTTGSTTAAQTTRLGAAQKALSKLGYGPVAIDGKMGASTRAAIRSFERDRGLPETGDLTAPTVKALQAMSGTTLP